MTKKSVNAEQFLKILLKQKGRLSDLIVTEKIEITDRNIIGLLKLVFSGIEFQHHVSIRLRISEISFNKCEFLNGFEISIPTGNNLYFTNCTSTRKFCKIIHSELDEIIFGSSKFEYLRIVHVKQKKSRNHLLTTGTIHFSGLDIKHLSLSKIEVSRVSFIGSNFEEISFGDSLGAIYSNELIVKYGFNIENFKGKIDFKNSTFNNFYINTNRDEKTHIYLHDNTFESHSKICVNTNIEELRISSNEYKKGLKIYANKLSKPKIEINRLLLENISFAASGSMVFEGFDVTNFQMSGVVKNLSIFLKEMLFKDFSISELNTYDAVHFMNCKGGGGEFKLQDSDLSSAKFQNFDFTGFKSIFIDNVILFSTIFENITWFEDKKLRCKDDSFKLKSNVYRQIKQSLIGSGSKIESLDFKSLELENYNKHQKATGKTLNWDDKAIIAVNKVTGYGLSWVKPFKVLVWSTLCVYVFSLPLISEKITYHISMSPEDLECSCDVFLEEIHHLIRLFNPLRKDLDYSKSIQFPLIYQCIDYLHRLVYGILLYHIIKGFRRYIS